MQNEFNHQAFLDAVLTQDATALAQFFAPNATIKWEDSYEEFSVPEYIRANCEYPGQWQGERKILSTIANGDANIVTVAKIYNTEGDAFHVVSFFTLDRDSKLITHLLEFYGDVGEPPQWRKDMNIGKRY